MRGLSYPILSVGFINSLFFGVYDLALANISSSSSPTYLHLFSSGCVAGAAQLVLAVPVDLIKIRLQAEQGPTSWHSYVTMTGFISGKFRGPFHCLKTIYNEGGLRGCYRGIVPMGCRLLTIRIYTTKLVTKKFMVPWWDQAPYALNATTIWVINSMTSWKGV